MDSSPPAAVFADRPRSDTFRKAVKRFEILRNGLTEDQKAHFATIGLEDIKLEIQRVQDRYGPEKKLRSMRRISRFLEAMSQIEQVVTVFLNVHDVVAFVWGPIKLGLVVASSRLETLECLLDTYVEVGEVIPGLHQYDAIFRTCPAVLEVLEMYFYDVLQFHSNALEVFARPVWKGVFHSTWKTFKTQFKPILESLKRHRALLQDKKMTAAIVEIQETRRLTLVHLEKLTAAINIHYQNISSHIDSKEFDGQRRVDWALIKSAIMEKLDAPNYKADQQASHRQRFKASGDGLLSDSRFTTWSQGQDRGKHTLYLHGQPGAGKSIMASHIVDHLMGSGTSPVLFFYFRHGDHSKTTFNGLLQALLAQILDLDNSLIELFHQRCSPISHSELCSLPSLQHLFLDTLKSQRACFIILDGLDECEQERKRLKSTSDEIIDWFIDTAIPACELEGGTLRLLISGQRDGILDQRLSAFPSIALDKTEFHKQDIERFARDRVLDITKRFAISKEIQTSIITKVTEGSEGMFLYAKVVLENLFEQGSQAELEDELKKTFPDGLEQAYERVVVRVLDRASPRKRQAAGKILGWVVCAARPLFWREIQSVFCINPQLGACDAKHLRVDPAKALCGSLVEVESDDPDSCLDPEPRLKLVHATAGTFLAQSTRVNLFRQHAEMALFCSHYLASSPFDPTVPEGDIIEAATSGYYGLQDYATAFWQYHIRATFDLSAIGNQPLENNLLVAVTEVIRQYADGPFDRSSASVLQSSSREEFIKLITDTFEETSNGMNKLGEQTKFIRTVIETMDVSSLEKSKLRVFTSLHGARIFKCAKLDCHHFSFGFQNSKSRDDHIAEHERPFRCVMESCPALGFTSRLALDAHEKKQHPVCDLKKDLFPTPKRKTKVGKSMWLACEHGDIDTVRHFIACGFDVQKSHPQSRRTTLSIAARKGHLEVCQILIKHGAKVFYENAVFHPEGTAPLAEAIRDGDADFFRALMNLTTEVERAAHTTPDYLWRAITLAFYENRKEMFMELLHWYLLLPVKKDFHQRLVDLSRSRSTESDQKELLDAMLRAEFPATEAGDSTDSWRLRYLQSRRPSFSALHIACQFGCQPVAVFLLDILRRPDLSFRDDQGNTVLHVLAASNQCDPVILRRVLEFDEGNCFHIKNHRGERPLQVARQNLPLSNESCWNLFLEYDPIISNDHAQRRDTCLFFVAAGHVSLAAKVLTIGEVDLEEPSSNGQSIFSVAEALGNSAMMSFLYSHDPSLATLQKQTLDLFVRSGNVERIKTMLIGPDAESLLETSWETLVTIPADLLTDNLLLNCCAIGRVDLAKKILQDRRLLLEPTSKSLGWNFEGLDDPDFRSLLVLRQLIKGPGVLPEHLDKLNQTAEWFSAREQDDADWKQAIISADPDIPFSTLASFAIHNGNRWLVHFLIGTGHIDAIQNVTTDPLTKEKVQGMGISPWNEETSSI